MYKGVGKLLLKKSTRPRDGENLPQRRSSPFKKTLEGGTDLLEGPSTDGHHVERSGSSMEEEAKLLTLSRPEKRRVVIPLEASEAASGEEGGVAWECRGKGKKVGPGKQSGFLILASGTRRPQAPLKHDRITWEKLLSLGKKGIRHKEKKERS